MSDSDIRLLPHSGNLLFALYIKIDVLSFGYAILGFSFSLSKLFNRPSAMSMTNLVAIGIEKSRIDTRCSLKKEFS